MNWGGADNLEEFKTIIVFLFHTAQTALAPRDTDNSSAKWVAKSEVANVLTHPKDKEFFKSIIDQL